jgi:hypothetical protein
MSSNLLPQMLLESFGTVVYTLALFLIFFNSSRFTVFSWTGVPLVRQLFPMHGLSYVREVNGFFFKLKYCSPGLMRTCAFSPLKWFYLSHNSWAIIIIFIIIHFPYPQQYSWFSEEYRSHCPVTSYSLCCQKLSDCMACIFTAWCIRIYKPGWRRSSFKLSCDCLE